MIAGLGNLILKDDGVGIHAVRRLQRLRLRGTTCVELGTAVLDGLHLLERADRIIALDAVAAGGEPGSVYLFGGEDAEGGAVRNSLHEVNLTTVIRSFLPGHSPQVLILGVEPEDLNFGLELSPRVEASLESLVKAARYTATIWNTRPDYRAIDICRLVGSERRPAKRVA